jgi:VanZ family protein
MGGNFPSAGSKLLIFRYITYGYLLLLFLSTVLPLNPSSSPLNNHYTLHIRWDYLLHWMVYLPLPVLLGIFLSERSREQNKPLQKARFWIVVAALSLLISTLFEFLQMVIPYRAFNINDLVANGVGVVIGLILMLIFRKRIVRI